MTVGELRRQLKPFTDETHILMATDDAVVEIDRVRYILRPGMAEAVLWLEELK